MKTADTILLDTNILVYAADVNSPYQEGAKALRNKGLRGELSLCIAPQIIVEFYAIITDSKRVNNPLDPKKAKREIEKYVNSNNIKKIFSSPRVIDIMMDLLEKHPVSKQKIHDLHLVATMLTNGITRLYTFNSKDFEPYHEIEVLTP